MAIYYNYYLWLSEILLIAKFNDDEQIYIKKWLYHVQVGSK